MDARVLPGRHDDHALVGDSDTPIVWVVPAVALVAVWTAPWTVTALVVTLVWGVLIFVVDWSANRAGLAEAQRRGYLDPDKELDR